MDHSLEQAQTELNMSDDSVDQMLVLAERLREANGGALDESAILAVAEATGAPVEYVRLAVKLKTEKEKMGFYARVRSQFRTLEPGTRRYLFSGVSATSAAMLCIVDEKMAHLVGFGSPALKSNYGLFTMLATICFVLGVYNVALSRDFKRAALSGAILGGGFYLMQSVFLLLFRLPADVDSTLFPLFSAMGAGGGALMQVFTKKYRDKLGLKDPAKERQDLLRQLGELQDKLSAGKQLMTFLSVDIVGSTRMKELADPLALEYTFNEYHDFVARITTKYGGRLHSTAGDGITCAFEHPQHAFAAAKNIQAGITEWNAFRNRIGSPVVVRCGIHTGTVMALPGGDVTTVNFAHVIDMAAHLQKVAPPGGIAVSEDAASQITGGASAVGHQHVEALDVRAVLWTPRKSRTSDGRSKPPKLPDIPKL